MKYLFKLQAIQLSETGAKDDEGHPLYKIVDTPTLTLEVSAEDAPNAAHKLQRALQGVLLAHDTRIFYTHDR